MNLLHHQELCSGNLIWYSDLKVTRVIWKQPYNYMVLNVISPLVLLSVGLGIEIVRFRSILKKMHALSDLLKSPQHYILVKENSNEVICNS